MLLSQALGLNQSQPMFDFVDIDLYKDFPLYIDPIGFKNPRDEFAEKCQEDIQDFFDAVLKAIVAGNVAAGQQLLEGLREPNETHLGVSSDQPAGRGLGKEQAAQVLESLRRSPAAQSGLLTDLTDAALFIPGIGADKISDMTTNIIRRHLIEYTQQQFQVLNVDIVGSVPTGLLWDTGNGRWIDDEYDKIPVVEGQKILLVPKRYVRWRGGLQQAASHYYNNFVTNFIRDEELRTNGNLVEVIKSKKVTKRVVRKSKIKEKFPLTKDFLAEFSSKHPNEYKKFRTAYNRHHPIGIRTLVEAHGATFKEAEFDASLIATLQNIPPGRRTATAYHHLIVGILTYLFYPHLISPAIEREIDDGRKRIDLTFSNSAEAGFFKDRKDEAFTIAREVMVECKNYDDDIANPELDQLAGRFDPRRGRFGLMLCRSINDPDLVLHRCRDMFQAQRGIVIVLSDEDVIAMLRTAPIERGDMIQAYLRKRLREIS